MITGARWWVIGGRARSPRGAPGDHAAVGRGDERPELGVLEVAVPVDVGAAAQPAHELVGEDAAAVTLPLMGDLVRRAREDHPGVGIGVEALGVEILPRALGVGGFDTIGVSSPPRQHQVLAATCVDEEVVDAGPGVGHEPLEDLAAREAALLEREVLTPVAAQIPVTRVVDDEARAAGVSSFVHRRHEPVEGLGDFGRGGSRRAVDQGWEEPQALGVQRDQLHRLRST